MFSNLPELAKLVGGSEKLVGFRTVAPRGRGFPSQASSLRILRDQRKIKARGWKWKSLFSRSVFPCSETRNPAALSLPTWPHSRFLAAWLSFLCCLGCPHPHRLGPQAHSLWPSQAPLSLVPCPGRTLWGGGDSGDWWTPVQYVQELRQGQSFYPSLGLELSWLTSGSATRKCANRLLHVYTTGTIKAKRESWLESSIFPTSIELLHCHIKYNTINIFVFCLASRRLTFCVLPNK